MAAQKINEGLEHLAKAEKYLKTGFLKWKPDYDSAASEYGKAAVAFKNAKQFEQAKDACLREAAAHENNRALFHAAKAYEQAGMMLKVSDVSQPLQNHRPGPGPPAQERLRGRRAVCPGELQHSWLQRERGLCCPGAAPGGLRPAGPRPGVRGLQLAPLQVHGQRLCEAGPDPGGPRRRRQEEGGCLPPARARRRPRGRGRGGRVRRGAVLGGAPARPRCSDTRLRPWTACRAPAPEHGSSFPDKSSCKTPAGLNGRRSVAL
ncbi:gamma-soluble NSF attachment protein isoform X3 [Camelus dromedarius]|uniref:gamma-soluble NSF attachment protein isoform X3 n=1 Tax=Camelus dromedarius TaxID=9838 RepID=UPI00311A8628